MKVLQINTVYGKGSTGRIVAGIQNVSRENGIENVVACDIKGKGTTEKDVLYISSWLDYHVHNRLDRVFWLGGTFSKIKTRFFLKKVKKYNPDIIHLHNIHGNYINIKMLFNYIKKSGVKVIWTLHDCWAFTGHCPYFDILNCNKWQTECFKCKATREYPQFNIDRAKKMYNLKKELFAGVKNMTLVTPSDWLKNLVKQSFLKDYPVKVIRNGIDLSVFTPTESGFRKKYGLENKFILLGVAFDWGKRKGLDVFIELSKRLSEEYKIVLVGTDEKIKKLLPENIIAIEKTNSAKELAGIYTCADLFVNPTREDNFPTVNMEANACGTPVLTFKTGGSPECITVTSGAVVPCNDIDAMEKKIKEIKKNLPYSKDACVLNAKFFDMQDRFADYIELYKKTI